jgi:hypothetical protein
MGASYLQSLLAGLLDFIRALGDCKPSFDDRDVLASEILGRAKCYIEGLNTHLVKVKGTSCAGEDVL